MKTKSCFATRLFPSLLAGLIIMCTQQMAANADVFTPAEKSVGVMNEATIMSASMLIQEYGFDSATLSLSGVFDDSTWSANLSGAYAGMQLSLSFDGIYSQVTDNGSFISTGTLGTATWSGSGTWNFIDIDATSEGMFWDSEATITPPAGSPKKPDRHLPLPKIWLRSESATHIFVTDCGEYFDTEDGQTVGKKKKEISDWVIPKDSPRQGSALATLVEDCTFLSDSVNFDEGIVDGTISIVPGCPIPTLTEWGLIIFGVVLLGFITWVFLKRRKAIGARV